MIQIVIISGALSYMPPDIAEKVVRNRQAGIAVPTLPADLRSDCYFAVPVGYQDLIGYEATFVEDDGTKHGPFPIIDVQNPDHRDMRLDGLAADVTCAELVHRTGRLIIFLE
jgi:hypothetical protein